MAQHPLGGLTLRMIMQPLRSGNGGPLPESKDDLAFEDHSPGWGTHQVTNTRKVTNDDMRHNCKMPLSGARSRAVQRGSTCVPAR